MASKDDFKLFASKHPELVRHIKNGNTTWQKLYEIYDIYGEQESVWEEYLETEKVTRPNDYNFKNFTDKLKSIDFNSIQEHINTAQKALGIVQELTSKGASTKASETIISSTAPRPINKIFED